MGLPATCFNSSFQFCDFPFGLLSTCPQLQLLLKGDLFPRYPTNHTHFRYSPSQGIHTTHTIPALASVLVWLTQTYSGPEITPAITPTSLPRQSQYSLPLGLPLAHSHFSYNYRSWVRFAPLESLWPMHSPAPAGLPKTPNTQSIGCSYTT